MVTWLMYMYQLDPLYKSYHFENSPGVNWVTGVKRSLKVDLELPTDWHIPILCIIFPLENPHCREKRYVEYTYVLSNLFNQCNLWRNITLNDNRFFILRNTPVLLLGIFLHNRYALLLRMETLATEKAEIVSEELKVCKRDKRFEGWDGYFRSLSYRLCLLMTMHCAWYWITCTAQLYYSHVSASVIATRWIWTKSPRCDGITCAVESYVANLGELINIHLIALSSKRLHLNWKPRSSGVP